MRKILFSLLVICALCFLQSHNNATTYKEPTTVSYAKDIVPILQNSCTPCHFPPDGRKEPLDSYEAVKKNIVEVLERVKLPTDHRKFMPFKSKNPC